MFDFISQSNPTNQLKIFFKFPPWGEYGSFLERPITVQNLNMPY